MCSDFVNYQKLFTFYINIKRENALFRTKGTMTPIEVLSRFLFVTILMFAI